MPALSVNTEAIVLLKRPSTSDSFQAFSVFSAELGGVLVLQRVSKKSGGGAVLDLFSEMSLALESSNQGRSWFVREARLVRGAGGIGRDYETLRRASEFAALVARNAVAEESRGRVYALLRQVFAAFAAGGRADIVYVKGVYRFARDEGYAVREQWFPSLSLEERAAAAALINKPLAEQVATVESVGVLRKNLEAYLRSQTDILVD